MIERFRETVHGSSFEYDAGPTIGNWHICRDFDGSIFVLNSEYGSNRYDLDDVLPCAHELVDTLEHGPLSTVRELLRATGESLLRWSQK